MIIEKPDDFVLFAEKTNSLYKYYTPSATDQNAGPYNSN